MAPKKAPIADSMPAGIGADDSDLEQAIDDLRGVLKSDAAGTVPETDFGATFAEPETDLSAFGGGFDTDFGAAEEPAFGATFGAETTSFDATQDFMAAERPASAAPGSALTSNLDLIMDIPIDVQIVLGSSRMQVSGLMNLTEGATIALDRKIGEPVEVTVNGRIIGRGEITVLENDDTRFGIKLTEVISTGKI